MNLLAHAYLSFNEPDILLGNMISDFVKGRRKFDFPLPIQAGILLHREIDAFTDSHPATAGMKKFFRTRYGLYAAPFTDIVYDHFLANDTKEFPLESDLKSFSAQTYIMLEANSKWFPHAFMHMFRYMQSQDWLTNYRFNFGIERSFEGLVRRATYMNDHKPAMHIFLENKSSLHSYYLQFFPELKKHAAEVLANLKK